MINKPKLQFILDKKYDRIMIYQMLRPGEPAGLENRANSMGIELNVAKNIQKMQQKKALSFLNKIVNSKYKKIGSKLVITKGLYQRSWNEINDDFFSFISQKTEYAWKYDRHDCVVSVFHRGISNWVGNKIGRIWSENPYTMRKITAHELIISHVFHIFHDSVEYKDKLKDCDIWKIAEISAWCLTGLEPKMVQLWPWTSHSQLWPLKHNYPDIVPLQVELGKIYKTTKNFKKFLDKAIIKIKEK